MQIVVDAGNLLFESRGLFLRSEWRDVVEIHECGNKGKDMAENILPTELLSLICIKSGHIHTWHKLKSVYT